MRQQWGLQSEDDFRFFPPAHWSFLYFSSSYADDSLKIWRRTASKYTLAGHVAIAVNASSII